MTSNGKKFRTVRRPKQVKRYPGEHGQMLLVPRRLTTEDRVDTMRRALGLQVLSLAITGEPRTTTPTVSHGAKNLLAQLHTRAVRLYQHDGTVWIHDPAGAMTQGLREAVSRQRHELLRCLPPVPAHLRTPGRSA